MNGSGSHGYINIAELQINLNETPPFCACYMPRGAQQSLLNLARVAHLQNKTLKSSALAAALAPFDFGNPAIPDHTV